jgi:hypothetical protein
VNLFDLSPARAAALAAPEFTIACVLRGGGPYDLGYVKVLAMSARRKLRAPHRFVCLTDAVRWNADWFAAHRIETVPLNHGWPGRWSKMELFRPELFEGQVFYFDLDTVLLRRIDRLARYRGDFAVLRDFHRTGAIYSGAMSWRGATAPYLYEDFAAAADEIMAEFPNEHAWIRHRLNRAGLCPDILQDRFPGVFAPFKPVPGGPIVVDKPERVGVVCFRGAPKPHQVADEIDWVKDHW